jgi:hypothetical protein
MPQDDQKIYRTFEEFEREELRRSETMSASVDDMISSIFGQELDFDSVTQRRRSWDDEEE